MRTRPSDYADVLHRVAVLLAPAVTDAVAYVAHRVWSDVGLPRPDALLDEVDEMRYYHPDFETTVDVLRDRYDEFHVACRRHYMTLDGFSRELTEALDVVGDGVHVLFAASYLHCWRSSGYRCLRGLCYDVHHLLRAVLPKLRPWFGDDDDALVLHLLADGMTLADAQATVEACLAD